MPQPKLKLFLATLAIGFWLDALPINRIISTNYLAGDRSDYPNQLAHRSNHPTNPEPGLTGLSREPVKKLIKFVVSDHAAYARSSGGRTRSGSFNKSTPTSSPKSSPRSTPTSKPTATATPSPSRSPSRSTSSDRSNSNTSTTNNNRNSSPQPINNSNNPGIVTSSRNISGSDRGLNPFWLILPVAGIAALSAFSSKSSKSSAGLSGAPVAMDNDTVTISKLQVALLANASPLQAQLTEMVTRIDTETDRGRAELLQEAVLALLRHSDYWSHVLASSDVVPRDRAEYVFNQLSIAERKNFSVETLTKVKGSVSTQQMTAAQMDDAPAEYIVVTLLLGTEHDRPLYNEVRSPEALQKALEKIAAIEPEHIAVLELLWSPQSSEDSMTYDELLSEYTNMVQL
jgi:uncharacterized membrane protein